MPAQTSAQHPVSSIENPAASRQNASMLDNIRALTHIERVNSWVLQDSGFNLAEDTPDRMMKEFFKVKTIDQALEFRDHFAAVQTEDIPLGESVGRVLATDLRSDINLPDFARSIMDGFAVKGSSTFGASEGNPAYLNLKGTVAMGEASNLAVGPGEAVRISTGEAIDDTTIEVYRSVAPGQNVIAVGEDINEGDIALSSGSRIRPQEAGMLAALGRQVVTVFKKPIIGIISTGDEIVPVNETPGPGRIRDINTYTLLGLVQQMDATAISYGIVQDDYNALLAKCTRALAECDMILVSGGSSVGARDFTIDVISAVPDSEILFHGISISPGKPTILARVQNKAFWGLPGHVVSAMVVFSRIVKPFIEQINGLSNDAGKTSRLTARLSRNLASAQGRVDYVRVRLVQKADGIWAEPILGKSGLINTMVKADGLIEIGMNTEGLDQGDEVAVIPM
jgi:molybdopterin molybdotransferase